MGGTEYRVDRWEMRPDPDGLRITNRMSSLWPGEHIPLIEDETGIHALVGEVPCNDPETTLAQWRAIRIRANKIIVTPNFWIRPKSPWTTMGFFLSLALSAFSIFAVPCIGLPASIMLFVRCNLIALELDTVPLSELYPARDFLPNAPFPPPRLL